MAELPFNCLTNIEFLRETGVWIYQCTSALNSKDLFADVLADPNKIESCENEGMSIESKYYDVKNSAKILKTGNKGFSLLHCNTRSLSKNLPLLNDILLMCKEMPGVIAISETKLSDDNFSNVTINGYKFISKHSPTNAGGVGLYIKEDIEFIRRQDIEFDFEGVETCFIEIPRQKNKNIIIGCIYRHPLVGQLSKFQDLTRKIEFYEPVWLRGILGWRYQREFPFLYFPQSNL